METDTTTTTISSANDDDDVKNQININVKFSGRSIPITISQESKISHLKSVLQPLTNVLPRGQKLISKGKILVDEMTLRSSEISNGAKVMLMASQGLHQGDGPIKKEAPVVLNSRRNQEANRPIKIQKEDGPMEKSVLNRWKASGVVALSESRLKAIPVEVWSCGPSVRVLDLQHNSIQDVPAAIGTLSSLQKLLLNANNITEESISWDGLLSLKSLSHFTLNRNQLTTLPSMMCALTSLKQLHLANNKLICLPAEIGLLVQLEVLKANNNRLSTIPSSIGNCVSLVEVDLSSNLLVELPETIGDLHNLKALHLDNNGLKSLPATLFKNCVHLSTLDLHGTEITLDILRQFEGWENFDERRRLKHKKQLDFGVEGTADFDEGADKR